MNTFLLLEMPDIKGIYYTINNRNENMQKICREISLRFQIKIVYTNTWIETMSFLLFCYNNTKTEMYDIKLVKRVKTNYKKQFIINALALIDGVSFEKAEFIYFNFGGDNFIAHVQDDDFETTLQNFKFRDRKIGILASKIVEMFKIP